MLLDCPQEAVNQSCEVQGRAQGRANVVRATAHLTCLAELPLRGEKKTKHFCSSSGCTNTNSP